MTTVVEMVTYRLKQGVAQKELEATNESVNSFVKAQPGFLYRSLSQDDADQWFDIVYWENMDAAKKAGEEFLAADIGKELCQLIDMDSCFMRHMPVNTEMMSCEIAEGA